MMRNLRSHCMALGALFLATGLLAGTADEPVVQDSTPNGMPAELAQALGAESHPAMYRTLLDNALPGAEDLEVIKEGIRLQDSYPDETFFGNLKIKFPEGFQPGSRLEQIRVNLHEATSDERIEALKLRRGDARSALHALHRKTRKGPSSFTVDIPDEEGAATCWSYAGRENPRCAAEIDGVVRTAVTESGFGSWMNDVEAERSKALQAIGLLQRTARGEVVNLVAYLQIVLRTDAGKIPPGDLKNSAEILDDPKEHLGFEPEIDFDDLDVPGTTITAEDEGGYWIQPNTENVAWAYYKRLGVAALIGSLDRPEGFIPPYDPNGSTARLGPNGQITSGTGNGGLLEGDNPPCSQQIYGTGGCTGGDVVTSTGQTGGGGSGSTPGGSRTTSGGYDRYRTSGRPPYYGDGIIPGSAARSLNPRRRTEGQLMMRDIAGANIGLLQIAKNAGDNDGLKMGAAISALALTLGGAVAANQQEPAHVRSTVDFLHSPVYTPPGGGGTGGTSTTTQDPRQDLQRRQREAQEGANLGQYADNLGQGVIAELEALGISGSSASKEAILGTDQGSYQERMAVYAATADTAFRLTQQFDLVIGDDTTPEVQSARSELGAATANLRRALQAYRLATFEQASSEEAAQVFENLQQALVQFRATADLAYAEFKRREEATQRAA